MHKIKSITFRNFKFFYGLEDIQTQNTLDIDGNNLLLYGENGSGKSSIYWGLYTFLQSCLKDDISEIEKYFAPENNQNLRNRFASSEDESGIVIEFSSPEGGTIKEIKRNSDNTYNVNTFQDTFVKRVLGGSDFINYKYLSKIYDFRNSESIDLFDMFDRDIFMFIDFGEAYLEHDGTTSNSTYASDWWQFICDSPNSLPFNGNIVAVSSVEYKRLKNHTIPRFIELLKKFLLEITQGANEYLQNHFKEKFSVNFDIESITCDYNKKVSQRAKDGKIHKPIIPLHIKFNHHSLVNENKDILKPHTFLNEARLTAIALAIRLSILERRPTFTNSSRVLVLDDLLLSLDMSNRDKVLDILLSEPFLNTYQIFILSHDRAFYNMCKNRIQDNFNEGWVFNEMYQHETEHGIPCPFIPNQNNYLDLAKKYLKEFDYPASANYLRKEVERIFKYLLPQNLCLYFKEDKGMVVLQLDNLISNLLSYFRDLGIDIAPYKKLKEHKDLLLNPLSHDNLESPIYKGEIDNIIETLENFNKLKVCTIGLPSTGNDEIFELHETDLDGDNWICEFTLNETYRALKDLDGNWFLSNPLCQFLTKRNTTKGSPKEPLEKVVKLSQGYGNIRYSLKIRTKETDNVKDLKEIIFKEGTKLIDILNT